MDAGNSSGVATGYSDQAVLCIIPKASTRSPTIDSHESRSPGIRRNATGSGMTFLQGSRDAYESDLGFLDDAIATALFGAGGSWCLRQQILDGIGAEAQGDDCKGCRNQIQLFELTHPSGKQSCQRHSKGNRETQSFGNRS